jgi:serine/threonine protein kinase
MREDSLVDLLFAGRFRIESLLGSGATGTVYLARHEVLERQVAIKVLHRDLLVDVNMPERFRREAKAASRIVHPHITYVFDFGHTEEEGRPYIVMEYVEGPSLAEALADGPFPLPRALRILLEIAEALAAAHAGYVIHRDLKPRNIILTTHQGQTDHVKILDFGFAKIVDPGASRRMKSAGDLLGTPQYMSPEQCTGGQVDYRTDIYSFGVIAYELLVGKAPYAGDVASLLDPYRREPAPPSKAASQDIPAPVDKMVLRCLAKSPDDRYPDGAALAAELRSLGQLHGSPPEVTRRKSGHVLVEPTDGKTGRPGVFARLLTPPPAARTPPAESPESEDEWELPTTPSWLGHARQGDIHRSQALEELAYFVQDRGIGSPEMDRVLSQKFEAEHGIFELESAIALLEREYVEIETSLREREERLRKALNQIKQEHMSRPSGSDTSLEMRARELTQRVQRTAARLEKRLAVLNEQRAYKRDAMNKRRLEVEEHESQLVRLLQQAGPAIEALADPEISQLMRHARLRSSQAVRRSR